MGQIVSSALNIAPTMESEVEERKESWQDNGLQALAALSNTRGGVLWIGVKDNGDPVGPNGWSDAGTAGKMESISNQIVSKLGIHPSSMTMETLQGKPVLAIVVAKAASPVSLDGHYWRRVGNTSRKVPSEELTRFLLERTGGHWDGIPSGLSIDSLDGEVMLAFKSSARKRLSAIKETDDDTIVLHNLGMMDAEGRLTRAAVLLFGKGDAAQRLSATAFVQVGRFKGSGAGIADDKTVRGNLFDQFEGAMSAVRGMLQVGYEIPNDPGAAGGLESLERREVWEYPLAALREAIANALLHRDYTHGGRVMVRVYDDKLIVSSPGTLPEGITLEDLRKVPHPSVLRNPRLADGFFLSGIVERWGTGTTRMAEACEAHGLPEPDFELRSGEFWVTFTKDPYTDERLKATGLSNRQIKGVRLAQTRGSLTNAIYREELGVSARTAASDLAGLVACGVFVAAGGKGAAARYQVANAQIAQRSRSDRAIPLEDRASEGGE